VGQNMQNNGVTVQDLIQQARDGTLNQQSLIDQGIVSQDMIDNVRNQVQTIQQQRGQGRGGAMNGMTLQQYLGASDDEWAILYPKIQRVTTLSDELARGFISNNRRMTAAVNVQGQGAAQDRCAAALAELDTLLANADAPAKEITDKLAALRQVKERVKAELHSAEADLIGLVTLRQEAILLTLAYIELGVAWASCLTFIHIS